MATTEICTGIQAFRKEIFRRTDPHEGASLLQMKASPPDCLVNIAMKRSSERLIAAEQHTQM
jgi:hypothetical protein